MSSFKVLCLSLTLLGLGACSLLNPFVDRRRNAGEKDMNRLYVGESTPQNPAVCYNYFTASLEDIQKLADEECVKQRTGDKAIMEKQTYFSCRLLLPNHIYFKCVYENEEDNKNEGNE
ncbi:MAG: hypothetical protein PHE89_06090 [Alphaproteobacteria bacterium]|nr:hypothetical protein [Alphaproteobacteria bacterium]